MTQDETNRVEKVECPNCGTVNHLAGWQRAGRRAGVEGGWPCWSCDERIPSDEERMNAALASYEAWHESR